MTPSASGYRGRFAPSPTGPLHYGSLVAAMASYLDARARQGDWLLRMEDVDETRTVPGAADDILRTLDAFGFQWQGQVLVQSRRKSLYGDVIAQLRLDGNAFDCGCSRADISASPRRGPEGPIYPGTCRDRLPAGKRARSVRLRVTDQDIAFTDRIAGPQRQDLAAELGDFVIRRADGYTAYQLAVVVDDAEQGINQVVRGADLLRSTPRQIYLQGLLGLPTPSYAHVPLALGPDGRKLSKQDRAHPVLAADPLPPLLSALAFLGQLPPPEPPASIDAFWQWAIANWDIDRVPTPTEP
jgi:glutamyl-Q tRNA(Asp) synthetase